MLSLIRTTCGIRISSNGIIRRNAIGLRISLSFTDANYTNNPYLQMTAFEFAQKKYQDEFGLIADPMALFFGTRSGLYIQTVVLRRDWRNASGTSIPAAGWKRYGLSVQAGAAVAVLLY